MKFKLLAFLATLIIFSRIIALEEKEPLSDFTPWYTGPIISISGENVDPSHVNINPYLVVNNNYGQYNSNWHASKTSNMIQTNHFWLIEYGVTKLFDILLQPGIFYNTKKGSHYFGADDFSGRINIQILTQIPGSLQPSLRFMFRQNFPTGKYDKFNPSKNGTESTGKGCFETILGFNMGKIVYWLKAHPIRWRINISYSFTSTAHVEGFNAYGGGYNTYGTVHPGNTFNFVASHEFSLTQRWVLALELQYQHYRKTSFHGTLGTDLAGNTMTMGSSSGDSFVLAPALEYSFPSQLGFYAGATFTFAGRNTFQVVSPTLALTYTW